MEYLFKHGLSKSMTVFLFLLYFLPAFMYVYLDLDSMSLGVLAVALLNLLFIKHLSKMRIRRNMILYSALLATAILLIFVRNPSLKGGLTLLLLAFVIVSLSCLVEQLNQSFTIRTLRNALFLSLFFLSLAVSDYLFPFSFNGYDQYPKSVFPFSEPSHLALAVAPLAIISILYKRRFLLISFLTLVFLGLLLKSLIFIFLSVFILFLYSIFYLSMSPRNVLLVLLSIVGVVITYDLFIADDQYFSSRLYLSAESKNLTVLSYLQGWENIANVLSNLDTFFTGAGIQKAESFYVGEIGSAAMSIYGDKINRAESSFTASKLIVELGLLGVFVVLLYLYIVVKLTLRIRGLCRRVSSQSLPTLTPKEILSYSFIISFFFEMFIRGMGYFSIGSVLFIFGFILLKCIDKQAVISK